MLIDTTYRSSQPEIMDDFFLEGEELRDALQKIATINRWLGGNSVTIDGIRQLIGNKNHKAITDVGCGNGDMLREIDAYTARHNLQYQLKGIDANAFTIDEAVRLSEKHPKISFSHADVFDIEIPPCDVIISTLTLHHFDDDQILELIGKFIRAARVGIVINDLHRSALAYRLFKMVSRIFRLNRMSEQDGLTSILRGFKRKDLEIYSQKLNLTEYSINWMWAFRYQWIIKKL